MKLFGGPALLGLLVFHNLSKLLFFTIFPMFATPCQFFLCFLGFQGFA